MSWQAYPLSRIAIDLQPGFARQPKSGETSMSQLRTNNVSPEGRIDLSLVKAVPTSKREIERYSLLKGDILFNNTNSVTLVGKTAFFDLDSKHFLFSNHMTRIRVNEVIADPRFIARYLYWIWKTGGFRMMVTRWVNQAAINKTMLGSVNIQLPPISEQRRVVEILDQADALRKKHAEAEATAARILPVLFYKMFGDPATNPKGLDKKRLGDLIKVRSGNFLPAKNMDSEGQYPVYGGNGINGYHSEYMFEQPVIVLGRVGAYCGAIYYSEPNCWVTDNALYVAEQSDDLHPPYLTEALRVANLNQYAGRAGQPLISGNRIYPVEILVPPPEDQETFARSIVNLHRDEKRRKDADGHIQKLFSVLLHRAFTGDLTAKWREAHMQELLAEMEEQAKVLEAPLVMKGSAKAKSK
jgi:type I restriction enzyme S subunit